ncbi:MAG: GxxExxY protein [Candidatus Zambryskibacteria bacterium]|nr:GxxExxY protein [Candidatus Zambryskibacteria bacterium]
MKKKVELIYPELSYIITGLLFKVHSAIGQFGREKQYGNMLQNLLLESGLMFEREKALPIDGLTNRFTNKVDFAINNLVLLDLKAKPIVTKEDFAQMKRYLDAGGYKLGLIANFHQKFLKPVRVVRAV